MCIFRRRQSRNYNQKVNHRHKAPYADSEDENDPRRRRQYECDSADSSELCYPPSSPKNNNNSSEDGKSNNHALEENINNDNTMEEKAKKIAENEALKQARIEAKQKVHTFGIS